MTALAEAQLQEVLARLEPVARVITSFSKHDEPGATALLLDVARIRHRITGWLRWRDHEPAAEP